jgi:nitrogen regulatory protein PII 2
MKEIIAIIRMDKVSITKKVLADAGFPGLTALKVMGRGKLLKDLGDINKIEDGSEDIRDMLLESMLKGGRLIPKRMLIIAVHDNDVKKVVDAIISVNKEGKIGDGKIFVLPLFDAVMVRTGERGEQAI